MKTMIRRVLGPASVLVASVALAGCATMFQGREQQVRLDTVNMTGATCAGVDKVGQKVVWKNTPSAATVIKGDGPMTITCEAKGFKKTTAVVDETIAKAALANVVTLGLGALVDAASGAAQPYPDVIQIPMEPLPGASMSARAAYDLAIEEIEEARRKEEEETKRMIRGATN